MVEIENLSKIGFGSYRVSGESEENEASLRLAIQNGCNLIDTSSNYKNGESEKLIGKFSKEELFITTKAGYLSGDNLKRFKRTKMNNELVEINSDFFHCIHPEYLKFQMDVSFQRLNRRQIDCFLLHNPEYYFKNVNQEMISVEGYYSRIKKSFEFLEEMIKKGQIRFYGISSNTFASRDEHSTNIEKILQLASEVSSTNHFKFIQFPYNHLENNKRHDFDVDGLINTVKQHGIKTISNRPLNANTPEGPLRLFSYYNSVSDEEIECAINDLLSLLNQRLRKLGKEEDIEDFPIISKIVDGWEKVNHDRSVKYYFRQYIIPFLNVLYSDNIPPRAIKSLKKIEYMLCQRAQNTMSLNTKDYFLKNNLDYQIIERSPHELIKSYFDIGIDHVLVGMNKTSYVESLNSIFS